MERRLGFHARRRGSVAPIAPGTAQRGETLAEVLVTITLLGFGFILVFGGLFTVAKTSEVNTRRTKASNGIQAWGEGLQQPAKSLTGNSATDKYTYVDCAYAGPGGMDNSQLPVGAVPNSWRSNALVIKVEILTGWSGTSPQWKSLASETDRNNCIAGSEDKGLQRITLRVSTPTGETPASTDTLTVVRRKQECPSTTIPSTGQPAFNNADLGPC